MGGKVGKEEQTSSQFSHLVLILLSLPLILFFCKITFPSKSNPSCNFLCHSRNKTRFLHYFNCTHFLFKKKKAVGTLVVQSLVLQDLLPHYKRINDENRMMC